MSTFFWPAGRAGSDRRGQHAAGGEDDDVGAHGLDRLGRRLGVQLHLDAVLLDLPLEIADQVGDVLELAALDERRQRQQAAELRRLLDERHVVAAQRRDAGGLHARRAAAHDDDLLLRLERRHVLIAEAHGGVKAAVPQELLALVEAGAAARAGRDVLGATLGQLVGQVGVAHERPVHADEVGRALLQQLLAVVGRHVADEDDGHGDQLLGLLRHQPHGAARRAPWRSTAAASCRAAPARPDRTGSPAGSRRTWSPSQWLRIMRASAPASSASSIVCTAWSCVNASSCRRRWR